jgi:hypothetical protein
MQVVDFDADGSLLQQFLDFPRRLHAADPNWLPDPGEARWLAAVARRKFLVMEGDDVYGRAAVMVNPRLCDGGGRPYGQLGFFECLDDLPSARLLVDAALAWLRTDTPEVQTVLAPINFDTWHSYRLRTRGFDQPTFLMEPYNPPYYPTLFTTLGFAPVSAYLTKTVSDLLSLLTAWGPYHQEVAARGYTFRSFNPAARRDEMACLYRLSLAIFHENLFFVGISEEEFRALYEAIAAKVDPDLLVFVLNPHAEPLGFSFAVPDHRQAGTVNLKTFGILPGEYGAGVGAALACEAYRRFRAKGFTRVNHCLMRAGNRADQFDRGLGDITREYTLYARSL